MRKLVFAINITPDGFCDHSAVIADDEHHQFANDLLHNADTVLFGRNTYQLYESYWPIVAKKLYGPRTEREFGKLIDHIEKIVFSRTLEKTTWKNSYILDSINKKEILALKQSQGKDIVIFGSPSVAAQLLQLGLIDIVYFSIQPILLGTGLRFPELSILAKQNNLKLISRRTYKSGVVALGYEI